MQSPSIASNHDLPQQVCTSCKARKKKCNKALPKCSSCSKSKVKCEYLTAAQRRSSESTTGQFWPRVHADDFEVSHQLLDFPTMLFLHPDLLQHGQVELPRLSTPIPAHILDLLGDMDEICLTAARFFKRVHVWMPLVSKKRFYEIYLRSSFRSRPDIALLLLSFKLITALLPTSPRNPRTILYHNAKHFYCEVEGSSLFSLPVLQAGVLIALYELGHGIYPAAFLSIGACARYAQALGINGAKTPNMARVVTLVEVEERRRVWWAIIILDRFVSIGCPGRPFASAEPNLDDFLPADNMAWDQGTLKSEDSFTLSFPTSGHMSQFALLCQAARLLGQVLNHVASDSKNHDNDWMQLDRTLQSMLTASLELDSPDYNQIAFIYSAIIALYTPWIYSSNVFQHDTEHSMRAKAVAEQITERIIAKLVQRQCFLGRSPEDMSPWGMFFAYHICGVHMRSARKNSDSSEVVKSLKEAFLTIDARWNVAGVYLQLLEAQEIIHKL